MTEKTDISQTGTIRGWLPMMLAGNVWITLPLKDLPSETLGIPQPQNHGDILHSLGLYGEAQAHALAWWAKAVAASRGNELETRIDEYEIHYNMSASKCAWNELRKVVKL